MASAPRVIFRGPPGMRKAIYYFIGSVFTGAGCLPGLPVDAASELASVVAPTSKSPSWRHRMLRYATRRWCWPHGRSAWNVLLLYAFEARHARHAKSAPLNPKDPYERLHNLSALYRRDRTSAVEIEEYAQGKGISRRLCDVGASGQKVPSSILLGEDVTLGYQLEAAPTPMFETKAKNPVPGEYWSRFRLSPSRGDTGLVQGCWRPCSQRCRTHGATAAQSQGSLVPRRAATLDRLFACAQLQIRDLFGTRAVGYEARAAWRGSDRGAFAEINVYLVLAGMVEVHGGRLVEMQHAHIARPRLERIDLATICTGGERDCWLVGTTSGLVAEQVIDARSNAAFLVVCKRRADHLDWDPGDCIVARSRDAARACSAE
ncbi:hypothetical protein L1887_48088 [Cichorium endivia]|nr:hypothetical protein L1887_48088 [Cichorium endivia]